MASKLSEPDDGELLRLMLAGDAGAFTTLYERRQAVIYRFALRMSGSEALAEDVTQDVFLTLMRDGGQYDAARGSLTTYLYTVTRNRVLRLLARDKIFVPVETDEDNSWEDNFAAADDPLADLSRRETIESVRQAVLALPLHYRELVILCYLQETTYEDAARITGCALGTVRSRLSRGRALLVEKLRAQRQEAAAPARLNLVTRLAL
jgi:RNA polymerase sigma-70 factor (ECF subfamily)